MSLWIVGWIHARTYARTHARAKLFGEIENSDRSKTRERIGCERILDHAIVELAVENARMLADRATGEKKRRGR